MQELAPGMRNVLPFLIRDAKYCILLSLLTHKVSKSPKSEINFGKECMKAEK